MTGGVLRTKIADMQVGDYIKCSVLINGNVKITLSTVNTAEMSVAGNPFTSGVNGHFYFIKADKGLLIADRVCVNTIAWDKLNSFDYIQGAPQVLFDVNGIIRSLGGGNSYASATGTSSTTDAGLGAWPVDNEWDEYIVRKDYGTGAGRDDVWHYKNILTWAQDTIQISITAATYRVTRGYTNPHTFAQNRISSTSESSVGFRPVFQYSEVTP